MLLAREAVNLNRSAATEGTLLSTLLRSPAAIATFPFPIQARPLAAGLEPGRKDLAVGDDQKFSPLLRHAYPPRGAPTANECVGKCSAFLREGRLAVWPCCRFGGLALLDARTFKIRRFLSVEGGGGVVLFSPLAIAPDNRTAFLASAAPNPDGSDGAAIARPLEPGNRQDWASFHWDRTAWSARTSSQTAEQPSRSRTLRSRRGTRGPCAGCTRSASRTLKAATGCRRDQSRRPKVAIGDAGSDRSPSSTSPASA